MTAKELFLGEGLMRPIITALYGASAGGLVGGILSNRKGEIERLKELVASNPVDVDKFVAKYDPEIKVMHGPEDIDTEKYGPINQFVLKQYMKDPLPQYMQGQKEIIAPREANPYAIAHEIGHSIYEKDNKPISAFQYLSGLSKLTGKESATEEGAWAASPIEVKDEGEEIKDLGLGSYKRLEKYFKIGTAAGTAIGAGISIPYLLKHLRK